MKNIPVPAKKFCVVLLCLTALPAWLLSGIQQRTVKLGQRKYTRDRRSRLGGSVLMDTNGLPLYVNVSAEGLVVVSVKVSRPPPTTAWEPTRTLSSCGIQRPTCPKLLGRYFPVVFGSVGGLVSMVTCGKQRPLTLLRVAAVRFVSITETQNGKKNVV